MPKYVVTMTFTDLIYIEQAIELLGHLTKNGDNETDQKIYENAQKIIENILQDNPKDRDNANN